MPRKSRVEAKALELLAAGQAMCKYDLAAWAHCDQRTAQRMLARIHKSGDGVRIAKWVSIYQAWIPIYRMARGVDVPRPLARTSAQKSAKRRRDLEVRWAEMMQKRGKRIADRQQLERSWYAR